VFYFSIDRVNLVWIFLGSTAVGQIVLWILILKSNNNDLDSLFVNAIDDDMVRIQISILQLFKNFKFSLYLLLIYLFYCFMMIRYEISHFMTTEKYCQFFILVPPLYITIDYTSNRIMAKVKNWYLMCTLIMSTQILGSIAEVLVRLNFPNLDYIPFLIFAFNMILMQKVVFISINSTMLQIFDVENLRVRNYMSCEFNSDPEPGTLFYKSLVVDFCYRVLQL